MFIVVGLGNPGLKYKNTRHNVGFSVLDLIASELNINIGKLKHRAIIGEGNVGEEKIVLVKPQTYMNLSGESIKEIVDWYRADILKLILIYDDIDLPLGKIRIRRSGSAGSQWYEIHIISYKIRTISTHKDWHWKTIAGF